MSSKPSALVQAFASYAEAKRISQGITRYRIAHNGGPGESTLRAIENNQHAPKLTTFVAICQALGDDPVQILAALLAHTKGTP